MSGAAKAAREAGNQSGILGAQHVRMSMLATRPGRTHRWSFREDADGLTPRLNLPARIGGLERACEADTTGAKGGFWSPKAGLGKVSEVWAFKRPYRARGGARAQGGKFFSRRLPLLPRAL